MKAPHLPVPTLCLLIVLIISGLVSPTFSHAQDTDVSIAGSWEGNLKVPNGSLRIVFHIISGDDGLSATLDSPDQGATGIPVSQTTFSENKLTMEVAMIAGSYSGTLSADHQTIDGEWSQGGINLPLLLSKTDKPAVLNRPQEPSEPYPYKEENVFFDNEAENVRLAGTLTLPETPGPHPAVVLVSGSGPQNRDEELMGHKPFLVLADHLTKQGIAVLRYDDRGTAESTGDFSKVTTEGLARDAQAAVDFLKTRNDIDANRIGVAGHSEGGLIAPMLGSKENNIAFVVMLAGPGLPGHEILRLQSVLMGRASGMSESLLQEMTRVNGRLYDAALEAPENEVENRLKLVIAEIRQNTDEDTITALGLTADRETQIIQQLSSPWFRFFLNYDPAPILSKVKVPVLSIIGSKDLQVPADENTRAIKAALTHNPNIEVQILPDLNHLFQTATTGAAAEYAQIEETFAPTALNLVSNWILSTVEK